MKLKKLVTLGICCALAGGMLSGCGPKKYTGQMTDVDVKLAPGYPVKTDAKLTYWVPLNHMVQASEPTLNETPFAEALKKQTGIDVTFIHPPTGADMAAQDFNLMIASGDLPDIVEYNWFSYPGGPSKAISDHLIHPLNLIMKKTSPNILKVYEEMPDVERSMKTDDGQYFSYPFIRGHEYLTTFRGGMIRKDLLDKAGLDLPETLDEWETVLRAFKKMGVKYPLHVFVTNGEFETDAIIVGGFGIIPGFFIDDNDKVQFGELTPEYKEFIKLLKRWYDEGLIPKDFTQFQNDEGKKKQAAIVNGEVGIAFGTAGADFGKWMPILKEIQPGAEFVPLKPVTQKKGERAKFGQKEFRAMRNGAAITTKCSNIEAAARLLDFGYSEKGHTLYNFGVEGVSFDMVGGKHVYTADVVNGDKNGGLSLGQSLARHIRANYDGPFVQDIEYMENYAPSPMQKQALRLWSDSDSWNHRLPLIIRTAEENKEYSKILQDVNTYRNEMLSKFLIEPGAIDKIDMLADKLREIGVERIIQINQDAYDRFKAK